MKACGESINDLQKIEKVLRSLTVNFDYIVIPVKETKNLVEMKLEKLQASLEEGKDVHFLTGMMRKFQTVHKK